MFRSGKWDHVFIAVEGFINLLFDILWDAPFWLCLPIWVRNCLSNYCLNLFYWMRVLDQSYLPFLFAFLFIAQLPMVWSFIGWTDCSILRIHYSQMIFERKACLGWLALDHSFLFTLYMPTWQRLSFLWMDSYSHSSIALSERETNDSQTHRRWKEGKDGLAWAEQNYSPLLFLPCLTYAFLSLPSSQQELKTF